MNRHHGLAVLLLAALLPGQTRDLVSPRPYDAFEGPAYNSFPFTGALWSYQQLHDDLLGSARIVYALNFRKDGYHAQTIAPWTATLTLRLSQSPNTAATASTTFAANHGNDLLEVLANTLVNFPGSTPPAAAPAPWAYTIPFPAKFFLYKGAGSLCWELRIFNSSGQASYYDVASGSPTYRRYGQGCLATGQTAVPYHYAYVRDNASVPNTWRHNLYVYNLAMSQPYVAMVGVDNRRWAGLALPFDLAPLGGAGCSLYLAPLFLLGGTTPATGSFTNAPPLVFPKDPYIQGAAVFSQVLSLDPPKAGLPLSFTDGCETWIPYTALPVCRLYTQNDASAATAATYNKDYGLIIRFSCQ